MFISMNWIRDFVDLSDLDLDSLIHRFTLSTAEVEDIYHKGTDIQNVVVGKILTVDAHPNSKKLHVLTVDGGDKIYDVVCGAPNVRVGMKVPFAREGGKVGEMEIKVASIAGVESHGMCCSEFELGISADHSGLMEITDDIPIGTLLTDAYQICDTVFEVDNKSLTNRPDLWGHYGIAREFAALTGRKLRSFAVANMEQYKDLPPVEVDVQDKELVYRYSSLKVRHITQKVSPVNMRIRLFYCGTRAINLLADLTNYLMLELGQPMHAFDCAKVNKVEMRRFDAPFTFRTLDGNDRKIDENMLMITSGGEPVAVAGVMGGLDSEIEDDTDSLLLESANFDGISVRKTSTRLGLRTDASMRYEKILDPELTVPAIARFLYLLQEIDPDVEVISSLTDCYVKHYAQITLHFTRQYVDRYTGIAIDNATILQTLTALGFAASLNGDDFTVVVPSWRATKDVTIPADIIEEITRIYGYDNFQISTTHSALYPVRDTVARTDENRAKDLLAKKFAMHEVHSYIWGDAKKYKELGMEIETNVKLLNAASPDNDTLRRSMEPTLISFVNENKTYAPHFGIFEVGRVVEGVKENGECNERKHLGIAMFARDQSEKELFFAMRNVLHALALELKHVPFVFAHVENAAHAWQHPVNTIAVSMDGKEIGSFGTLHPAVADSIDRKACVVVAELDLDALAELEEKTVAYQEPSKFPGMDVDLSLLIRPDTKFADLAFAWEDYTVENLQGVSVVDIYEGAQRSMTVRLTFCSAQRTLARGEVQSAVDGILARLAEKNYSLKQ